MTDSNSFINCPTYETENFLLRKLATKDFEELFSCYSDPLAAKFFNGDNCGISFYFDDKNKFKECMDYWLKAQDIHDFIRFTIVSKVYGKALGTIEICPSSKYSYKGGKVGILRLDIKSEYETKTVMEELLGILISNLYKDFKVDFLLTKAITEAYARIATLNKNNFNKVAKGEIVPFDDFFVR
jgi:RimJ/RimL family protein N-acetyltransferase